MNLILIPVMVVLAIGAPFVYAVRHPSSRRLRARTKLGAKLNDDPMNEAELSRRSRRRDASS